VDSPSRVRDERVPHTSGGGVLPLSVERSPSLARRFSRLLLFFPRERLETGVGFASARDFLPCDKLVTCGSLVTKRDVAHGFVGGCSGRTVRNVLRSLSRRCRVGVIDENAIESLLLSECHGTNVDVIPEAEERLTHNGRDARYPGMNRTPISRIANACEARRVCRADRSRRETCDRLKVKILMTLMSLTRSLRQGKYFTRTNDYYAARSSGCI